jgi:hypothetical protein
MYDKQRFAIVITSVGRREDIVEMPWLEMEYHVDESDWLVLSNDGWRAVADGDPAIWDALERKLLVGFYVTRPQLVVVIGHPSAGAHDTDVKQQQDEVRRIVRRIKSLILPAGVIGIWTDEYGALQDVLEPDERGECEPAELQPVH